MTPDVVVAALTVLAALLSWVSNQFAKRKGTYLEKLGTVVSFASDAVLAAERYGQDHGVEGNGKYDMAAEALSNFASRFNIKLSDHEIAVMLHGALANMTGLKYNPGEQAKQAEAQAPTADVTPLHAV